MTKFTNNLTSNNISFFLLLIFPACLVSGPLLAEVSMNLISAIFLYKIFKNKKFELFKESFFWVFMLFYFVIMLGVLFSNYFEDIIFKNIFYFRYVLFIFAVSNLLSIKKNLYLLFYKFLLIVVLIISIDGFIQFFTDYNLIGYPKIRSDRVSGFFGDDLILGSYLSRIIPLMFGLFIFNLKSLSLKEKIISIMIILISFLTVIISGERMAFYTIFFYFVSIIIFLNFSKRIKLLVFSVVTTLIILVFFISPVILDRHYKQTVDQVNFSFDANNFFSNFPFYETTYKTAFDGYLDKKIIGQGAKSFRYFCNEDKFLNSATPILTSHNLEIISKNKILINSVNHNSHIFIKSGVSIFSYYDADNIKNNFFFNDNIYLRSINLHPTQVGDLINPKNILVSYNIFKSGCTTHPHNFYLQLLSETGLIGFLLIFLLFFYLVVLILNNFISSIIKKKSILTNFQICLIIGFITTLLPIIPNGNFFNNWICMMIFMPVGFYINSCKEVK